MVITLVGSTKFKKEWDAVNLELSIDGHAVFSVALFGHLEGLDMSGPVKKALDASYMKKIEASDAIYMVNPNGYIGMGACDELHYALALGKRVMWYEEPLTWQNYLSALAEDELIDDLASRSNMLLESGE